MLVCAGAAEAKAVVKSAGIGCHCLLVSKMVDCCHMHDAVLLAMER